ncbi:MAG: hypothetical protein HOQ24_07095 [Mycobacteriaceae bacterium]|nr:hypothetical protein [Mycobacteriaceae bacterium]
MSDRWRPSAVPTKAPPRRKQSQRDDDEWYDDLFGPVPTPFYQRTGVLVAFAALGVLVLAGVGGFAWTRLSHASFAIGDESRTTWHAEPSDAPTTEPVAPTSAQAAPSTTSAKPTTTTTTKSTTTTKTTTTAKAADSEQSQAVADTGRFSGVIATKRGGSWVITEWDGNNTTIRVTSATQLVPQRTLIPGRQLEPGQTVSVFWHSVGGTMVADRIYGIG